MKIFLTFIAGLFSVSVAYAQLPPVELIERNSFESASSAYQIVFVTDQTVILEAVGQTAVFSAVILDSAGQTVDSPLTWQVETNPLVSILDTNENSVQVQLDGLGLDSVAVTASNVDLGVANDAQVIIADLAPEALYVSSEIVLDNNQANATLVLQRNPDTESIQSGDVIISGDLAGVLVRVLGVMLTPDQVILSVEPANLTDALMNAQIHASSPTQDIQVRYDAGQKTVSMFLDSELYLGGVATSGLDCRLEDNSEFGLEIVGGTIDWGLSNSLDLVLEIDGSEVQRFSLTVNETLNLDATTGSLEFSSVLSGTAICELELDAITAPPVPVSVFSFNLAIVPRLGVSITGSISGPSFSIIGPTGTIGGGAEVGIEYLIATGWEPVGDVSWSGTINPLTAEFDPGISFSLNSNAYGAAGLAIEANLGYPPFGVNLASLEFAEVRGSAILGAELSNPFDPALRNYSGPAWSADGRLTGIYKSDLDVLEELTDRLGIPVTLTISGNIFDPFEFNFAQSPQINLGVTCNPGCPLEPNGMNSADLLVSTTNNENGTAQFLASRNNAEPLIMLATGSLTNGVANESWNPGMGDEGIYDVFPRVETDALSAVFPYAITDFETFTVGETTANLLTYQTQRIFLSGGGALDANIIARDLGSNGETILTSSDTDIWGLGYDLEGNLYFGKRVSTSVTLWKRTPDGSETSLGLVSDGFSNSSATFDVAVQDGFIYYQTPTSIIKRNLGTDEQSTLYSTSNLITGLAFDDSGALYFGERSAANVFLRRVFPDGNWDDLGQVVDPAGGSASASAAFDVAINDGILYYQTPKIFEPGTSNIIASASVRTIDLSTLADNELFTHGVREISGLAFDQEGNLYYGSTDTGPFTVELRKRTPAGVDTSLGIVFDTSAGGTPSTKFDLVFR